MFNIKILSIILSGLLLIFTYQTFKIKSLDQELTNSNKNQEILKDKIKTQTFETKWQTKAQEHNQTKDKNETFKTVTYINDECVDINFFGGMWTENSLFKNP